MAQQACSELKCFNYLRYNVDALLFFPTSRCLPPSRLQEDDTGEGCEDEVAPVYDEPPPAAVGAEEANRSVERLIQYEVPFQEACSYNKTATGPSGCMG